ncbi:hypothetical protein [Ammoniphilus sp. CFH 90114]|uniref:hypothetical protein n=1 Tax=Ammoniphilus sp. CFH 90114 TaxID=2493665 RepID=UPI0013E943A5|nr:hypothetical protein [Ammoniphilus sp. CFH 90114]
MMNMYEAEKQVQEHEQELKRIDCHAWKYSGITKGKTKLVYILIGLIKWMTR